jgi:hypothetical protein
MTTRMIPLGTFQVRKDTRKGWPHDDFRSAEAEAAKLAAAAPGSTFIVMQDVARVTIRRNAE